MRRITFLVVMGVALAGCTSTEPPPTATAVPPTNTPVPPTETPIDPLEIGDPARGREIYETDTEEIGGETRIGCSLCHTLDGTLAGAGISGPSFQGISERAGDSVPELSAVEYLRQSIVDPSAYVVQGFSFGPMPDNFGRLLSEEDIDDLVAFLLTQ